MFLHDYPEPCFALAQLFLCSEHIVWLLIAVSNLLILRLKSWKSSDKNILYSSVKVCLEIVSLGVSLVSQSVAPLFGAIPSFCSVPTGHALLNTWLASPRSFSQGHRVISPFPLCLLLGKSGDLRGSAWSYRSSVMIIVPKTSSLERFIQQNKKTVISILFFPVGGSSNF